MATTQLTGLTNTEVAQRMQQGQFNKPVGDSQRSAISIILKNIVDLPTAVIFTAVAFLLIYGQQQDAFLISGIMILNTLISIIQEIQARNYLRSIQVLKKELVNVIRQEVEQKIPPENIVLNDIIKISGGKYLYVDGKLLQCESLLVDESILTGESDYVTKQPGDQMLSGSFVINGVGYYEADKIGSDSFLSKITAEAKKYVNYLSPLQNNINQIVKILVYLSLGTIALMFVVNQLEPQLDAIAMLNAVISIITSMVPQGIILTITIALSIGIVKMARKHIIVQRTNSIETMAELRILCMDKTGTITANKLQLMDQIPLNQSDKGSPQIPGEIMQNIIAIFCEYSLEKNKTLLAIGEKFSSFSTKSAEFKISGQIPFNSKIKMSAMDLTYLKKRYLLMLGPLEVIGQRIELSVLPPMVKLEEQYAQMGRRNLFFACKEISEDASDDSINNPNIIYSPLLFISIEDQLRSNAAEIIRSFQEQGIKPVIISGDGPKTLESLVKKLNLPGLDKIITGKELADLETVGNSDGRSAAGNNEFAEAVIAHDVFARVTPEQKVKIIKVFQDVFQQVAMIGDGVNDALALKASNLGIALGSGAEVTKNIADVVLLDNNLFNLSQVMNEGRIILHNSLRSAQLLLVKNFYALIVLVFALILALPFPFNPRSLMVLAFFVGNPPILMVLADQRTVLTRTNFLKELYRFLFLGGLIAGIIGLGLLSLYDNPASAPTQTILLSFFIGSGLVNYLLVINNTGKISGISLGNWRNILVLLLIPLYFAMMAITPVREFLYLQPLDQQQWLVVAICIGIYAVLFDLANRLFLRKPEEHPADKGN